MLLFSFQSFMFCILFSVISFTFTDLAFCFFILKKVNQLLFIYACHYLFIYVLYIYIYLFILIYFIINIDSRNKFEHLTECFLVCIDTTEQYTRKIVPGIKTYGF